MHAPHHLTLTPALLVRAYAAGVFPMAEQRESDEVFWVEPRRRGILPLEAMHVPRSLAKVVRQDRFTVTANRCFRDVMMACAEPRPGREQTWINESILNAYTALHGKGFAHSIECWSDGRLVGGLYGVALGAAFFGESMFSRVTDASKVALVHLVARLKVGGYTLLDTQFLTAHLAQFGTIEISRTEYRERLRGALEAEADFFAIDAHGVADGPSGARAPVTMPVPMPDVTGLSGPELQAASYSPPSSSCAAGAEGVSTTVSSPLSGKLILQLLNDTL